MREPGFATLVAGTTPFLLDINDSFSVTFGALVSVFQDGHLSSTLDVESTAAIEKEIHGHGAHNDTAVALGRRLQWWSMQRSHARSACTRRPIRRVCPRGPRP